MVERTASKKEFATSLIDLRDSSKLQWIKVLDDKSLTMICKRFAKYGWFYVYRKRYDEHFVIFSSGVNLEKDLPPKAHWVAEEE